MGKTTRLSGSGWLVVVVPFGVVACSLGPPNNGEPQDDVTGVEARPEDVPTTCEVSETDCTADVAHADRAVRSSSCKDNVAVASPVCRLVSCEDGYAPVGAGDRCAALPCRASADYGMVDCSVTIDGAAVARRTKHCNAAGSDFVYGSCALEQCAVDYVRQGDRCTPRSCAPTKSLGEVECTRDIYGAALAVKRRTCNAAGTGFTDGACTLRACAAGYVASGNTCRTMACVPGSGEAPTTCWIAYSSRAYATRTCNASGLSYDYGPCLVDECQAGYVEVGNSCVVTRCTSGLVDTVDCSAQIVHAKSATRSRQCNAEGTDYGTYGDCTLLECQPGYGIAGNHCEALACVPGARVTSECTAEIYRATSATRTSTCYSDGSGYGEGPCLVASCAAGYDVVGVPAPTGCVSTARFAIRWRDIAHGVYDPSIPIDLAAGPPGFEVVNEGPGPGRFLVQAIADSSYPPTSTESWTPDVTNSPLMNPGDAVALTILHNYPAANAPLARCGPHRLGVGIWTYGDPSSRTPREPLGGSLMVKDSRSHTPCAP